MNNTIRVIQRQAYGLRDEESLRRKILTCLLPALYNGQQSPIRFHEEPEIKKVDSDYFSEE